MVTAEELTVAIRSEGVSETQDDLEGVESAMEDTADSAGTAADDLEGFSQRFQGAMSAAIAGLAVGVAGLAASVPVVGELFAGFGAILEALLFQVDRLARSLGVGGLTDSLFDIADEDMVASSYSDLLMPSSSASPGSSGSPSSSASPSSSGS